MKRRSFLLGTAACVSGAPRLAQAQTLGFKSKVTCVVITDIEQGVSVEHLLAVFDAFTVRGLPFTCMISPFGKQGQVLQADDRLAILLSSLSAFGATIDFGCYVPDLARLSTYFQGRRVRDTNAICRDLLVQSAVPEHPNKPIHVVACNETEAPAEPTGVRSAGVNTVLVLP